MIRPELQYGIDYKDVIAHTPEEGYFREYCRDMYRVLIRQNEEGVDIELAHVRYSPPEYLPVFRPFYYFSESNDGTQQTRELDEELRVGLPHDAGCRPQLILQSLMTVIQGSLWQKQREGLI